MGKPAVRALFHIARNDEERCNYLLQVLTDPRTGLSAHSVASEYLAYVADERVRTTVLEHLRQTWPSDKSVDLFRFFSTVGETRFMQWVDETFTETGTKTVPRSLVESYTARVRVQQSEDKLLAALEEWDGPSDKSWLLRQAWRHGADRNRIRSAVIGALPEAVERDIQLVPYALLVRDCDERGVLENWETPMLSRIRRLAKVIQPPCREEWPRWAEATIQEKERKFWHIDRDGDDAN